MSLSQTPLVSQDEATPAKHMDFDVEAALSVLLSGLDDKTKQACLRPQSVARQLSEDESNHYADLLELALRRFEGVVQSRIEIFHSKPNDPIPFNTLPTELVAEILIATIPSEGDDDYNEMELIGMKRLRKLASVSKSWMDAVKTCPQLWTVLGPGPPSEVAIKLKNSGSLPLTIKVPMYPSAAELKNFLSIVTEHCHRWSSVTLRYYPRGVGGAQSEAIEAINRALARPMPLLVDLELLQLETTDHATLELSSLTNSPLLQHLKLRSINILNLPTTTCCTLRTLHIYDLYYTGNFISVLMGILRECSELRDLMLNGISDLVPDDIQVPTRGPQIHLPNLERLECSNNGANIALPLLGTIRAEMLSRLEMKENPVEGKILFLEILHSNEGPSLLTTVLTNSACTSLEMDVVHWNLMVHAEAPHDKGVELQLISSSHWFDEIVHLLRDQPLPPNTPPITLRLYDEALPEDDDDDATSIAIDILKITQTIPQISTLALNCALFNVRAFFEALVEVDQPNFIRQIRSIGEISLPRIQNDDGQNRWEGLVPVLDALQARYATNALREAGAPLFKIRDADGDGWNLDFGTGGWVASNGDSSSDSKDIGGGPEGDKKSGGEALV